MGHQHGRSSYTPVWDAAGTRAMLCERRRGKVSAFRVVPEGFCKPVKRGVIAKEREGQVYRGKTNTETLCQEGNVKHPGTER